ncbi:MAG: ABC transporter permease [Bacteroidia bacterium]|nr:ABC transporter permease [Bacteroidia bacterium]
MKKIFLVAEREILQKIRTPSFIIMTLLTPLLIAGFVGLIIYLTQTEKTEQKVWVVDESKLFEGRLQPDDYTTFSYTQKKLPDAVREFSDKGYTCILWIAPNIVEGGDGAVKIIYKKSPGLAFQTYLKNQLEKILYEEKLRANQIDPMVIHNAKQKVQVIMEKVDKYGNAKDQTQFQLLGFFMGFLMFMFITVYGMMVFRSVLEEKTNRIVEIIISSIKPFQLLAGKILGVAVLGIGQFLVMAGISALLMMLMVQFLLKDTLAEYEIFKAQTEMVMKTGATQNLDKLEKFHDKLETFQVLDKLKNIDVAEVLAAFLLYFLGGYLLYSALIAAIASAVDNESDSQQFLMPVMLPLFVAYFSLVRAMENPDASSIVWFSYIPFTSPVIMMSRITSGIPFWEVLMSLVLLFAAIILVLMLAAKIYRTGILMYGQKVTWKTIFQWVFKN